MVQYLTAERETFFTFSSRGPNENETPTDFSSLIIIKNEDDDEDDDDSDFVGNVL